MLEFIKKLFITEIPKLEETTDVKTQILLNKLETLIATEGLDELITNDVVGIYILKVWFKDVRNLLYRESGELVTSKSLVYNMDYFDSYRNNIYYLLKQLHLKVKSNSLNKKQLEDVETIIDMFNFYLEE